MDSTAENCEQILGLDAEFEFDPVQRPRRTETDEADSLSKVYAKKAKPVSQHEKLRRDLTNLLREFSVDWSDELTSDLPKKWKIVSQDLLILPPNCFTLPAWNVAGVSLWKALAECFRVKRVAQESRVKSDDFRTPSLKLLLGTDPIVVVLNNGVKYSYDITKCMFSWGNITEKLRIASFDCSNETVVDLYAGIGYFTLVYLVHANAKRVIACEWNPDSVQALKNNLVLNRCEDRCTVLEGDNRTVCPQNCADRVNLGLIPSSEPSWPTACNALKINSGGYLHIHGNVDIAQKTEKQEKDKSDWIKFAKYAQERCELFLNERDKEMSKSGCDEEPESRWEVTIEHIEYVKSYGPRVDHLVVDLLCRPKFQLNIQPVENILK